MMDAEAVRTIHEADQNRMHATALGGDVAAYYASLIAGSVPEMIAAALTESMQELWLEAKVGGFARISVTLGEDDE